jgi:hypothetical protein
MSTTEKFFGGKEAVAKVVPLDAYATGIAQSRCREEPSLDKNNWRDLGPSDPRTDDN